MRKRELVWIIISAMLLYLLAEGRVTAKQDGLYSEYETMTTIIDRVLDSYVEEVEPKRLFYGAYDGMLATLDPYSSFLPPQDKEDLEVDTVGQFGGVGIEITVDERKVLTVETPLEGTPAFFAGVRPGDKIVEIEGESTRADPSKTRYEILRDAVKKLRGPKGTKVRFRVFHVDTRNYEDITITRDIIKVNSIVSRKMVDEDAGIGYIRLSKFQQKTAGELDKTVKELLDRGMKSLIVDLRFNPGGLLDTSVEVSNRFIEKGKIVSTRGRTAKSERVFKAKPGLAYDDFPLAVLISPRSASASEIFAGCVQDHKRGIIIGERSFGKGSVQTVIPLEGGRSAIKLTTAKYYTPSGRCIHRTPEATEKGEWGIHPDIEVKISFQETLDLIDSWRKEHLIQTPPKDGEEAKDPETDEKAEKKDEPPKSNRDQMDDLLGPAGAQDAGKTGEDARKGPFVDRQLEAAVSVLKGVMLDRTRLGK